MTGNLVLNTGSAGDLTLAEDGMSRAGDLTVEMSDSSRDTTLTVTILTLRSLRILRSKGRYRPGL